jgi:hypothetical protein
VTKAAGSVAFDGSIASAQTVAFRVVKLPTKPAGESVISKRDATHQASSRRLYIVSIRVWDLGDHLVKD